MAMADVDSSSLQVDSQPKMVGLVWKSDAEARQSHKHVYNINLIIIITRQVHWPSNSKLKRMLAVSGGWVK